MHGYKVFFNGREAELKAASQYEAKLKAIEYFKVVPSKRHMVSVVLCEKDIGPDGVGTQVTHSTAAFG